MSERNSLHPKEHLDNIWNEDILKFPRIENYLKNEVIRQRDLLGSLVRDVKVRNQIDTDKKMKDFDREINLNRILNRNAKYRGIGRNKPPLSNFLEPILVANIRHNPTKILSKITIDKLSRTTKRCPKFIRHMREYDDNEFRRVYALGSKPEEEQASEEQNDETPPEEQQIDEENKEINTEDITDAENLAELIEANTDNKNDLNTHTQEVLAPIKEEPEQNKNKEEDEATPRVLTPASDILDDNLPSYASEEQYGVSRNSPNLIIPKNQAAQVKFTNRAK